MSATVEPPPLAHLLDLAERPRVDDWSFRAAMVRYGQREPQRISEILELVRRIEAALQPSTKMLEKDGASVWPSSADDAQAPPSGDHAEIVGLLQAAAVLDHLGDRLATWAVDPDGPLPDAEVDETVAEVTGRLDALGIPRESRDGPPRRRG